MKVSLKSCTLMLLLGSALLLEAGPIAIAAPLQQKQVTQAQNRRGLLQYTRNALRQNMAQRLLIPASQVRISQIEDATFNGCLDIAPRDAACPAIGIFGWRVTLQGGSQRWIYHVTQDQKFRLNGLKSAPASVTQAALRDAANRSGVPIAQLRVNWVEQKTWRDGCFELPLQGGCTALMVPGWRVVIASNTRRWAYRTDSRTTVQFEPTASKR